MFYIKKLIIGSEILQETSFGFGCGSENFFGFVTALLKKDCLFACWNMCTVKNADIPVHVSCLRLEIVIRIGRRQIVHIQLLKK